MQLMLLMLVCCVLLGKHWTADAHDAGLWWASGKKWAADAHDAGLRCASGKKLGS